MDLIETPLSMTQSVILTSFSVAPFSAVHAVHGLPLPGTRSPCPAAPWMADACQQTDVKFLAASEDFASYNFYFELLSVILYGVSFRQIQTFNQNTIFSLNSAFTNSSDV